MRAGNRFFAHPQCCPCELLAFWRISRISSIAGDARTTCCSKTFSAWLSASQPNGRNGKFEFFEITNPEKIRQAIGHQWVVLKFRGTHSIGFSGTTDAEFTWADHHENKQSTNH